MFNGSKSQLMIFGGGQQECDIYIVVNKVDIVTCMTHHLGHTVTNDINDSLVKPFLAYFNDVAFDVKNALYKQIGKRF